MNTPIIRYRILNIQIYSTKIWYQISHNKNNILIIVFSLYCYKKLL